VHKAVVYLWGRGHSVLLVGVYVDDLIITSMEEADVEAFKAQMKGTFQMSDLSLLYFYSASKSTRMTASSLSVKLTMPSTSSS
jgi:hypothetical protein